MQTDNLMFRVWDNALNHYRDEEFFIGRDGALYFLSKTVEPPELIGVPGFLPHETVSPVIVKDEPKRFVVERCRKLGRIGMDGRDMGRMRRMRLMGQNETEVL